MTPSILEVQGLTKHYRRVRALSEVSFSVRRGEILGLIGPNGAGKTTLFECLAAMAPADAGDVRVNGAADADRSSILFYLPDGIAPWRDQRLGWLLDYVVHFFRGRAPLRDAVVERLQLGAIAGQTIGTLSKGQRKRALLAIGLLTPQPVLLVDEPFDGLDLRQTRDAAQTLRWHAAEHGRTLVLSIHQIADAAAVCDRFVLLSGGRVCGEGTLEELVAHAKSQRQELAGNRLEDVFLALT